MQIKKFVTGVYDVNTYLIYDETTKEAAIIDYGGESEDVLNEIKKNDLQLKYILNTHGHFDHISGEKSLAEKFKVPVYAHKADEFMIKALKIVLTTHGFPLVEPPNVDFY